MKYIVLIALLGAGYYFYMSHSSASATISSYPELLAKVESTEVTTQEVKSGANMLVGSLCNDEAFQKEIGSSAMACNDMVKKNKKFCESQVFSNQEEIFKEKNEVIRVSKRYVACVGVR